MISTVTTAVVNTVSSSAAIIGALIIIGAILLVGLLVQKEILVASRTKLAERWRKAVDIGLVPLLMAFAAIIISKLASVLQ